MTEKCRPARDRLKTNRRKFVFALTTVAAAGSLLASGGLWLAMGFRFGSARSNRRHQRLFVALVKELSTGTSLPYRLPTGERLTIVRRAYSGRADDFLALSQICPHLGCPVRWEPEANRYFCSCHGGSFDAHGRPLAGPPIHAGAGLLRYPLLVDKGRLFVRIPTRLGGKGTAT